MDPISTIATPIPIALGGTGQTTALAAWNALSPATTKGDLVTRDGSTAVRVPVGTDAQVLSADSTQASGLKWITIAASGTSLDGAYDFGGAGAGRTVTVDSGAVTLTAGGTTVGGLTLNGSRTIASAAGAVWDELLIDADVSLSGASNVTTATGFNLVTLKAPTITDAGTLASVSLASTLYIEGPPVGSGLTVTNPYSLWVDSGNVRCDGNLGVNTAAADRRLDVLDASSPQLRLTRTATSVYTDFQTDGSGYLIVNPTGVRITLNSTDTPTLPLEVYGTPGTSGSLKVTAAFRNNVTAYNASPMAGIGFVTFYTSGGAPALMAGITGGKENATDGSLAGFLGFHTVPAGGAFLERVRITSTGRVGIMTTTPVANEPTSRLTINDSDGAAVSLSIENTSSGQSTLILRRTGGTTARWSVYIPAGSSQVRVHDNTADRLVISATGVSIADADVVDPGSTNVLAVKNGTAPNAGVADAVNFYSSDDAAGHTIPSFYCEGTNVLATGQADSASATRVKVRINGTVVTLLGI